MALLIHYKVTATTTKTAKATTTRTTTRRTRSTTRRAVSKDRKQYHFLLYYLVLFMNMSSFLSNAATSSGGGPQVPGKQHSAYPITTGTSVVGIKYNGGVMLAADTMLSYGRMAKAQNICRLRAIPHTQTIIGGSGEYSDYQQILRLLEEKTLENYTTQEHHDDTDAAAAGGGEDEADPATSMITMTAKSIWNYLRVVMYHRRNRFDPYWNALVVAGKDDSKDDDNDGPPKFFLGMVDLIGTTIQEDIIATGFGAYLAIPLMREKWRPDLEEGEARALLEDCMKLLFYRDCRASNKIQLAKVTADGVLVSEPYELETSWEAANFVPATSTSLVGDGGW